MKHLDPKTKVADPRGCQPDYAAHRRKDEAGRKLMMRRMSLFISQEKFAAHAGMSVGAVRNVEAGSGSLASFARYEAGLEALK